MTKSVQAVDEKQDISLLHVGLATSPHVRRAPEFMMQEDTLCI